MAHREFRERLKKITKADDWWSPSPGDLLTGILERVDTRRGKFGEQQVFLVRDDESGTLVGVPGWTVIVNELAEQQVTVGDRLGIKYLGEKGNYKDFIVLKDAGEAKVPGLEA